jgi:hypothetical protein
MSFGFSTRSDADLPIGSLSNDQVAVKEIGRPTL